MTGQRVPRQLCRCWITSFMYQLMFLLPWVSPMFGQTPVLLGASKSGELPQDLFVSGEARGLSVQVEGGAELPRTSLLSVPYALKAGDAATPGGLPASAFVLAPPSNSYQY